MVTPMTAEPNTKSDMPPQNWIKEEGRAFYGWTAAVGVALFGFWFSNGTTYHQLAAGGLMSSATLFASMAIFEVLWHAIGRQRSATAIGRSKGQ